MLVLKVLKPRRVNFDQLPPLLLAGNALELLFMIVCSWLALPVLRASGGWMHMPVDWEFWINLTLYLPATLVLLRREIQHAVVRLFRNAAK
ncbi:MAG: hypothetical protein FJZ87_12120 [Chloroflexi bacterium]|nr:hypothetical protein [Chloroflexota bacterium]